MHRLALGILLAAIAAPSFALTGMRVTPHRGDRIGILVTPERYVSGSERAVAATVRHALRDELRAAGYDAFDAKTTLDELSRRDGGNADYYIEVAGADRDASSSGALDIGTRHLNVGVSMVVERVAAHLRLFDGRTLELIDTWDLRGSKTSPAVTSIGIGGWPGFLSVSVPWMQQAQYRSAAHAMAKKAVASISGTRAAGAGRQRGAASAP